VNTCGQWVKEAELTVNAPQVVDLNARVVTTVTYSLKD